jgi:hypothetical protein
MHSCFTTCSCSCGREGAEFDTILARETAFGITMHDIAHSNMGWFCGRDDPTFGDWSIHRNSGIYMLWEKDDYCPIHDLYHCRALYVGKGAVEQRIKSHSESKRPLEDSITYFTYMALENRKAKYVEQLILDLYDIPMNSAENLGSLRLCAYITQSEADFGS